MSTTRGDGAVAKNDEETVDMCLQPHPQRDEKPHLKRVVCSEPRGHDAPIDPAERTSHSWSHLIYW
jgi:hypothetical protein